MFCLSHWQFKFFIHEKDILTILTRLSDSFEAFGKYILNTVIRTTGSRITRNNIVFASDIVSKHKLGKLY